MLMQRALVLAVTLLMSATAAPATAVTPSPDASASLSVTPKQVAGPGEEVTVRSVITWPGTAPLEGSVKVHLEHKIRGTWYVVRSSSHLMEDSAQRYATGLAPSCPGRHRGTRERELRAAHRR